MRRAGITRLADLTGLDFLGIPVYQAIRPNSRNLSVAQGKGVTRAHAKASALMEALEFFHAESVCAPQRTAPLARVREELGYDPADLLRPSWSELTDDQQIDWVSATDLATGAATLVPVQLCELDARVQARLARVLFLPTSNGLASGNTFDEAVSHGLYELVERDAVAADEHRRFSAERGLRLDTVDSGLARRLLAAFSAAGMQVHVHVPPSPTGRPCFEAFCTSQDLAHVTFYGAGCHPRKHLALIRALCEVAQSRLTYIAGSRDDLDYRNYPASGAQGPTGVGDDWPRDPALNYRALPEIQSGEPLAELHDVVAAITAHTGNPPMAVDLSRPEIGLPVVFVVAPGLGVRHYNH